MPHAMMKDFCVQMRSHNEFLPSNWSEPLTLPLDDGCDESNATDSSDTGKIHSIAHSSLYLPVEEYNRITIVLRSKCSVFRSI